MAECRRVYGQGPFWGGAVGRNPTERGKKGTKRSLIVDEQGGPLGMIIDGANINDHKLLAQTIEAIVVERTFGWLSKCRAILVRYDKHDFNYLGLLQLA